LKIKLGLLILNLLSTGCAATLISSQDELHVIGFQTGTYGHNWYDSSFQAKANKLCRGGYELVEKSQLPKAIENCGTLAERYDFYWVIKCKKI
jgi:hypothetical protein